MQENQVKCGSIIQTNVDVYMFLAWDSEPIVLAVDIAFDSI